jgi:hypothetical protein
MVCLQQQSINRIENQDLEILSIVPKTDFQELTP